MFPWVFRYTWDSLNQIAASFHLSHTQCTGFFFTGNTLWRSIWSLICVQTEKRKAHSSISNLISKEDYSHMQRSMKVLLNLLALLPSCAKLILPIILNMSDSNFSEIFLAWSGGMLNILYHPDLRRSSKLFNILEDVIGLKGITLITIHLTINFVNYMYI